MRLISQDRETDIQYERASLYINEGSNIAAVCNGETWLMGTYETHKRAREVVKEVRDVYYLRGHITTIYEFPER